MKKILLALTLLLLCGSCEPAERQTGLKEETVDVTDPWSDYSYVIIDSVKYLKYECGHSYALANPNKCTVDHQKLVDQIVDSLRAIIKEEIRVRVILARGEETDTNKQTKPNEQ